MRFGNQPSWTVIEDSPESLNFAVYVGYAYGILPNEILHNQEVAWPHRTKDVFDQEKQLAFQTAWKDWWQSLVEDRKDHSTPALLPPYTSAIHLPEFRQLCEETWADFHHWWVMPAGGHAAMVFSPKWQKTHSLIEFIQEIETTKQKRVHPFRLQIDLVYGGILAKEEHTADYVVMLLSETRMFNREWWSNKIDELQPDDQT